MSDSKKWSESARPPKVVGIGLDYPLLRMRSEARGPAIALEVILNKEDRQGNNYLSMEWHEATSWGAYVSPNGVDCRIAIGFGNQKLVIEGRNLHRGTKTVMTARSRFCRDYRNTGWKPCGSGAVTIRTSTIRWGALRR